MECDQLVYDVYDSKCNISQIGAKNEAKKIEVVDAAIVMFENGL